MDDSPIDFQKRDINTRPEYGINGVFQLGDKIFEFLKEISSQNLVRGCYLSHYFYPYPPGELCQVTVGIRFNEIKTLTIINGKLDLICEEESGIVLNPGGFQSTTGKHKGLPKDIVVDYIICYSFEWLIRIRKKFKSARPSCESLGKFILQNKKNIKDGIMSKNIFRFNILKPITDNVACIIWSRFIHHLCNAYRIPENKEKELRTFLKSRGINISIDIL